MLVLVMACVYGYRAVRLCLKPTQQETSELCRSLNLSFVTCLLAVVQDDNDDEPRGRAGLV